MLKYIALLFNTVALLIYQFFFAEGITITQKIPASTKPETEFVVELTINKGSTSGFAKLQQDLPEGFTDSSQKISIFIHIILIHCMNAFSIIKSQI